MSPRCKHEEDLEFELSPFEKMLVGSALLLAFGIVFVGCGTFATFSYHAVFNNYEDRIFSFPLCSKEISVHWWNECVDGYKR